jgi:selenocysteine-specific elongation factor
MTPHIVLGTAGHIDHGKSSLVKMLTGTDPDRLAEEKKRGITIELGFAQLVLPDGNKLGVVDVPGHERFVKHMVAGATGVDIALLVIAADDGIMPQTVEHIAVLELLGVHSCVVALTKIDLVDQDWLEFIEGEIKATLAFTSFANAPIVGVSSQTGEGKDELLREISKIAKQTKHIKELNDFRMPVDRAFTIKGFGTVVTGSLWSGEARCGDELVVLPSGTTTRIRSVQMHGKNVEAAPAGNRVAVNLAGLTLDDIQPGDFLSASNIAKTSDRFDAEFTYLDPFSFGKPLKSGVKVHVAHGTREVIGRILFMEGKAELASGETALAQIRLDEPLPLAFRDRFIVRSYSPTYVIGGGSVLSAHPRRRTTLTSAEKQMLDALNNDDTTLAISAHLEGATFPQTLEQIVNNTGLEERVVRTALAEITQGASVIALDDNQTYYVRPSLLQKIFATLERELLNFHTKNPHDAGIAKEALRQTICKDVDPACFDALLSEAQTRGVATFSQGIVSHPRASAGAKQAEANAAATILRVLEQAQGNPPDLSDIAEKMKIDIALARRAVAQLVLDGKAERIDANRYYDAKITSAYRQAIAAYINANGPAKATELKETMKTTRKYAMPLLEYFDSIGFTHREGDLRVLGGQNS